jgi:hypothetical protein
MSEITELLTHKSKATQTFLPNTAGLYVAVSDPAAADTECDNSDEKSCFRIGDNIFIIGAGISIPESFCLSTPDTSSGHKLPRILFSLYPQAPTYNNTSATPTSPVEGDTWKAQVSAHGWTANKIYQWSGTAWTDLGTSTGPGTSLYHHTIYPAVANKTGNFFIPFENFEYLLNTYIDVVSGSFYDVTAAKYITGINMPFSVKLAIDHTSLRISMVSVPAALNNVLQSISPFIKISHNTVLCDLGDVNNH